MEVYGDDYHISTTHPGLSQMIRLKDIEITEGDGWHIQKVRSNHILEGKMSPVYKVWQEECLKKGDKKLPKY